MIQRALYDLILRQVQTGTIRGIGIASFAANDDFADAMGSALALLERIAPMKLRRVVENLRWIVNISRPDGEGTLEYHHAGRYCFFDYRPYEGSDTERDIVHAGLLIHEATHGMLRARGIPYDKSNRERVERICTKAENAFYLRAEQEFPGLGARNLRSFDASDWDAMWRRGRWGRFILACRRIMARNAQ